jgi:hypothetical protein
MKTDIRDRFCRLFPEIDREFIIERKTPHWGGVEYFVDIKKVIEHCKRKVNMGIQKR